MIAQDSKSIFLKYMPKTEFLNEKMVTVWGTHNTWMYSKPVSVDSEKRCYLYHSFLLLDILNNCLAKVSVSKKKDQRLSAHSIDFACSHPTRVQSECPKHKNQLMLMYAIQKIPASHTHTSALFGQFLSSIYISNSWLICDTLDIQFKVI